jgi:hypothetical protein
LIKKTTYRIKDKKMSEYKRWKCHNCNEIFSTNGNVKDEFVEHIYNCLDSDNFLEELKCECGNDKVDLVNICTKCNCSL